jgi:hypothetical protein
MLDLRYWMLDIGQEDISYEKTMTFDARCDQRESRAKSRDSMLDIEKGRGHGEETFIGVFCDFCDCEYK